MKNKWLIIVILAVLVIALISVVIFYLTRKRIILTKDNIKHIHFSYSTGNMMHANVSYDIDLEKEGYVATIKPDRVSDEAAKKVSIDKKTMEKLVNELNKYNITSWDGFKKSDKNVLDGDSFSLSIGTKNEEWIGASGYMSWPKNYSEVKGVFDSVIGDLYKVKDFNVNDFKSMTFSYSNGGDIVNSQEIYEIEKKDNKYIATIKEKFKTEDEIIKVEVDKNTIYSIFRIIDTYNVSSWDGFSEHDSNVLDGESFYFSLYVGDDKVTASGYMSWPDNYGKVNEEFTELFHSLYEKGE